MNIDAIVQVRFILTAEGGRLTDLKRNTADYYACIFAIDDASHDCRMYFGTHWPKLGESCTVSLRFLWPDLVIAKLSIGKEFTINEGSKVVATGRVVSIVKPDSLTESTD